ncbi:MAG: 5-formyltetrahydrofolate cyclo-ligase [Campylobacterales bacterium]|nr:5-formyltetrahydrofolate cyclo-ligase [Campylobacterales bacterium]
MTKSDFRTYCLQRLKHSQKSTKNYRDAKVRQTLQAVLKELGAKRVLAFWPMGFEADIRKTVISARRTSEVYLPFMDGVSFKMVPLRLPLECKAFGIYEPRNTRRTINLIDVAIVPAVGVDGSLSRIGFGKGMYDRFFPTLRTRPFTIFIQPFECRTTKYVCDAYDVRSDLLITPNRVYSMRNNDVKRTTRRGWRRHPKRCSRFFNFKKDFSRSF